jgi:predicted transcriptional regulator
MSTTTIRLPEELKARVAQAARNTGASTHSFILEAIIEKTESEERRSDFHAEAQRRWEEFQRTGKTVPLVEMQKYALGLARGENPPRPVARKFER